MKGNEDCTFDWLLIPGARGNLTNYGIISLNFIQMNYNKFSNYKFQEQIMIDFVEDI